MILFSRLGLDSLQKLRQQTSESDSSLGKIFQKIMESHLISALKSRGVIFIPALKILRESEAYLLVYSPRKSKQDEDVNVFAGSFVANWLCNG